MEVLNQLVEKANVLITTDKPKGFSWIRINKEWEVLRELVRSDQRYIHIGDVQAYDDGTKVEIYLKRQIFVDTTSDGWLLNNSSIRLFGRPGFFRVEIKGIAHGNGVTDLHLISEERGEEITGEPCDDGKNRCFAFNVELRRTEERFNIHSQTFVSPHNLRVSEDNRELLLLRPEARIIGQNDG